MRILVLSDVHANLSALEAVLASAPPHKALWSLGDVVGYGANPNECIELLREAGANPALVGNHDLAAVGLMPVKWFNAHAATAVSWTSMQLTEENKFRIRSSFTSESLGKYLLVHGSPRDPASDYVQTRDDAVDSLQAVGAQFVLCGHTHVPMLVKLDAGAPANLVPIEAGIKQSLSEGQALINPGSVGQPRDGDARAAAMLLDTDSLSATWLRVQYDVERAQRAILAAGLPKELALRLAHGW